MKDYTLRFSLNPILVLEPTTTAWMYQGEEQLKPLGEQFQKLVTTLAKQQVEFDLGCEDILAGHGSATGGELAVGPCRYGTVVLPPMTELGLDVYDVVQPTPPSMDIAALKEKFSDRLTFCGSVCVQTTLAWGTPGDVEREVRRRLKLFSTGGLFLGPTHAVQVGSPLENVLAMYRTAGSLRERIDDSILSVGGNQAAVDKINLAKLF